MCRSWLSFVGYHSKHDFIFIVFECYSDLLHLCATRDQSEKLHDIPHYNSVLKISAILILFSLTCGSLRRLPWTSYTGLKTPFISFFSSKNHPLDGWGSPCYCWVVAGEEGQCQSPKQLKTWELVSSEWASEKSEWEWGRERTSKVEVNSLL